MTARKRIEELEQRLKEANATIGFQDRIIRRMEKRSAAVALAWSVVSPDDKTFMFNAKHDDPDLFDVYNQLLYSFGRPNADGVVTTRLSS
jgi:hypothetical protein